MKKAAIAAAAIALVLSSLSLPSWAKKMQIVPGDEALERVQQLTTEINWNHNLAQAEAQARKQGKMIFWVQMLGDLNGAT
ncbi:MAG: hypothetical protein JSS86_16980 [Cyanobacteria bacterium SZAS LIN-2]|nr:hypothetical protein [Cyanobacteria bacterium SZAS LIN-3]MBS1998022.1 hypothetical protein [Cyanobacteria bacterium SZAS LIN-2]